MVIFNFSKKRKTFKIYQSTSEKTVEYVQRTYVLKYGSYETKKDELQTKSHSVK